jgi:hypothetical protein
MSTTPTLYLELEKSKKRLTLTSGRYRIGSQFRPPTVVSNVTLAGGTSANVVGRTKTIGRSPQPTEFTFPVQVWGDSAKEIDRSLADLQTFLAWAGDDRDRLFLVYKSNSDTPEPIFGQDGSVRYLVVKGELEVGEDYSIRTSREAMVRDNPVSLLLQPFAQGRKQKLARASGGVHVERVNSDSSAIVGFSVPDGRANYCPNPIFAHPTFGTGWTAGAGLVASENTDKRFVFSGSKSVYLVAQPAGSRVYYWAVSLSASTHVLSFRVKRHDSGVVDSSVCQVYFNNALQTSNYVALGDGWYLVWYAGTASASSVNYGIGLASGSTVSVYADGFQLETLGVPTPLIHADALGCSSVGPYHASVSSRSTASVVLPAADKHRLLGSGTISAIVTTPNDSYPSNFVVFFESGSSFRLYRAGGTWRYSDNTTEISATDPLTVGKRTHFHVRWGSSGIALYVNGVFQSSSPNYAAAAAIGNMYLLTEATPSLHANHVMSEYVVWGEELTADQILSDYQSKLTLSGESTSIPPIFWTKDGDNALDNANDSSRDNYGVALCVPGSAPALTKYVMQGGFDLDQYTLGNWELEEFINPSRVLYYELGGNADATCSGGEFRRVSISTTEASLASPNSAWGYTGDPGLLRFVSGKRFSCVMRVRGGSYLRWRHRMSTLSMQQPGRVAGWGGFFRNVLFPALVVPETADEAYQANDVVEALAVNTGGAGNVDIDYLMMMPYPSFTFYGGNLSVVDGRDFDTVYGVSALTISGVITGGEINLRPNTYNVIIMSAFGTSAGIADNLITTTLTFTSIEVTPRWELLQ